MARPATTIAKSVALAAFTVIVVGAPLLLIRHTALTSVPPSVSRAPAIFSVDRLPATTTYDDGIYRFDPVPVTLAPNRTAEQAYQAYVNTGLYPTAPQYSNADIQFCMYTDFAMGNPDATGNIVLRHQNQPVWMISFTNVPDSASGGMGPPGSPRVNLTYTANVVIVVDDKSGIALEVMSEPGPDPSPVTTR